MLKTFDKKLGKALKIAIVEDISKKMDRLVAQTNKLLKREGSPIYKYAKRAGVEPEPQQIVMSLAEFDPTGDSATYLPWIIKMVGAGMNLPEDGASLHGALNKYHRVKRSPNFKGPTDIMRISSFSELLKHISTGETKRRARVNVSGWSQYVENFFETGYYKVIRFDPRPYADQEIEVVATSKRVNDEGETRATDWILKEDATPEQLQWAEENNVDTGSWTDLVCIARVNPVVVPMMEITVKAGTVWCLANPKTAMGYLKDGPIYFFYKNGGSELFSSADNHFRFGDDGGWVDIKNNSIMKISDRYASLLSRMIVLGDSGKLEQLHPKGLKNIGAFLKRIVRKVKSGGVPKEWNEPRELQEGYSISMTDLITSAFDIIQKS